MDVSLIKVFFFMLLILILTIQTKICSNSQNKLIIQLSEYKHVKINNYQYAFNLQPSQIELVRSENGTKFIGNFSTLVLKNKNNIEFIYESLYFHFLCPALHKPIKTQEKIIQLQIVYQTKKDILNETVIALIPFKYLSFSFTYVITQYTPPNETPIRDFLNSSIKQDTKIELDVNNLIKNILSVPTFIYRTTHPYYPQETFLRMVRKELRLMNKKDYNQIIKLMQKNIQLRTTINQLKQKTKQKRPKNIFQIKNFPFQQSQLFRREDL